MSKKMSQKEAVFNAIIDVLHEEGVEFHEGSNVASVITREQRAKVNQTLFDGFRNGDIELETEFGNDGELRTYCSGLQSNWIRKDKRLNGGVAYVPKNPGSREDMGDAQLKALKQLLSSKTDASERAEIQAYIDQRKSELDAARGPKVAINYDALPAALRTKYTSGASKTSAA
jgi:hypothetical protein